jgi:hypothetical protein
MALAIGPTCALQSADADNAASRILLLCMSMAISRLSLRSLNGGHDPLTPLAVLFNRVTPKRTCDPLICRTTPQQLTTYATTVLHKSSQRIQISRVQYKRFCLCWCPKATGRALLTACMTAAVQAAS